mgnify:CR=1 FL=1
MNHRARGALLEGRGDLVALETSDSPHLVGRIAHQAPPQLGPIGTTDRHGVPPREAALHRGDPHRQETGAPLHERGHRTLVQVKCPADLAQVADPVAPQAAGSATAADLQGDGFALRIWLSRQHALFQDDGTC